MSPSAVLRQNQLCAGGELRVGGFFADFADFGIAVVWQICGLCGCVGSIDALRSMFTMKNLQLTSEIPGLKATAYTGVFALRVWLFGFGLRT